MRALISDTARWGELTIGPKIIDRAVEKRMAAVLQEIRSGKFARVFMREMKTGRRRYKKLLREARKHPIESVGRRLRRRMRWKTKTTILDGAAALAAQPYPAKLFSRRYLDWPITTIGLAVVGNPPDNLSHRCGIPETELLT